MEMGDQHYDPPDNSRIHDHSSVPSPPSRVIDPPHNQPMMSDTSVIRPVTNYDPFLVPWDLTVAKGHSVSAIQTAKKVANFQKKLEEDDEDEGNYCPCCGNPLNAEKFPLWCSLTHLSELGEGIPLYYDLIKWISIGFLGAFFIASIYCLNENYGEKKISEWSDSLDSNMILEGSLANFGRTSEPSLTQPWLHVGCMWLFFAIHQYCLHRHKRMCASMDRGVITPSDYTCVVNKLPTDLQAEELATEISRRSGSKVSHINLAYSTGELSKARITLNRLKAKKTKLEHIRETTGTLPRTRRCLFCRGPEESLDLLDTEIREAEGNYTALKAQIGNKFTGIAFVTFEQDESKS